MSTLPILPAFTKAWIKGGRHDVLPVTLLQFYGEALRKRYAPCCCVSC
ncbi:hypothetical protein OKW45_005982 [Paraburkholderia sp. WSM4175]